jgi:chromate transporter
MRLAIARFMSDSITTSPGSGAGQSKPAAPGLAELFISFVKVALSGFGGALPWARRMIVEQKRWMTAQEFNEAFALSQFLPGPNVVNFSVVFGSRFGGVAGAAAAFLGLMLPPIVIVVMLAALYARYGDLSALGRILSGVTCAAVGLLMAVVAKMATPLFGKRWDWAPLVAVVAFVGVAILRWPLPYVFLGLAPLSIALAWYRG